MSEPARQEFVSKANKIFENNTDYYYGHFAEFYEGGRLENYRNQVDMCSQLSPRFQKQGRIEDQENLLDIIYWKLPQEKYEEAKNKIQEETTEEKIRQFTEVAFKIDVAATSLDRLTELSGVNEEAASAVLMFYKPEKYVVMDPRLWNVAISLGMRGEAKEGRFTPHGYQSYNNWCRNLCEEIREEQPPGLNLRQLETTLYSAPKQVTKKVVRND